MVRFDPLYIWGRVNNVFNYLHMLMGSLEGAKWFPIEEPLWIDLW